MATPFAEHDFRVSIFYGLFVVRDSWCDAADPAVVARGAVAAASTYQLEVRPRSLCAAVDLTVRVWAAQPVVDATGWDGHERLALHCPTGDMVVEQITAGPAGVFAWPAGAGVYGLHVYWRSGAAADEAERSLDGTERVLIDAWLEGPLPPDDDDEEFHSEEWG